MAKTCSEEWRGAAFEQMPPRWAACSVVWSGDVWIPRRSRTCLWGAQGDPAKDVAKKGETRGSRTEDDFVNDVPALVIRRTV